MIKWVGKYEEQVRTCSSVTTGEWTVWVGSAGVAKVVTDKERHDSRGICSCWSSAVHKVLSSLLFSLLFFSRHHQQSLFFIVFFSLFVLHLICIPSFPTRGSVGEKPTRHTLLTFLSFLQTLFLSLWFPSYFEIKLPISSAFSSLTYVYLLHFLLQPFFNITQPYRLFSTFTSSCILYIAYPPLHLLSSSSTISHFHQQSSNTTRYNRINSPISLTEKGVPFLSCSVAMDFKRCK